MYPSEASDLARVDYVKCSVNCEYDRAQELSRAWYAAFEDRLEKGDKRKSAHVNSVRQNADGTRLYIFEAWGPAAQFVDELDFPFWSEHLERMDVRESWDITRKGVDLLYKHATENNTSRRNIQLYDSKARSKRSGRDSGGYGVAIGSHKSDWRMAVYVRVRKWTLASVVTRNGSMLA